jgi:DNA-binding beta-propeller fold protein YncE
VVDVGSPVEGVVIDGVTRTVAAALRGRRLALLDADTGTVRSTVGVPGTARHLQLAKPGGPVLVPGEDTDLLAQIGLPAGQVVASARVGRQPHDAAYDPVSGRVAVTDELGGSVSFVEGDRTVATVPGPVQPGGLAVAGGRAAVVDVRGAAVYIYDVAQARQIARLDAGNGPTHAVPLPGDRVAVADTRGGAVLVYALDGTPRLLEQTTLADGPYGLGVDEQRNRLYVALSATNLLIRFDVDARGGLHQVGSALPTVQQANSLGVDPRNGRLFVGSSVDPGSVQITDPPG